MTIEHAALPDHRDRLAAEAIAREHGVDAGTVQRLLREIQVGWEPEPTFEFRTRAVPGGFVRDRMLVPGEGPVGRKARPETFWPSIARIAEKRRADAERDAECLRRKAEEDRQWFARDVILHDRDPWRSDGPRVEYGPGGGSFSFDAIRNGVLGPGLAWTSTPKLVGPATAEGFIVARLILDSSDEHGGVLCYIAFNFRKWRIGGGTPLPCTSVRLPAWVVRLQADITDVDRKAADDRWAYERLCQEQRRRR